MKAMILAAGRGERLRPLTDTTPKPLLKVGEQTLISYHLRALANLGITDVIINVCHLAELIQQHVGDGSEYGLNIYYSYEPVALETGGGIFKVLPQLGAAPFLVISADIWTDYPLQQLPREPKGLVHLVMVDNPAYHPRGDFALQGDALLLNTEPALTFGNIGIYRPELFNACKQGAFRLAVPVKNAITTRLASGEVYRGLWKNIGTLQELQAANKLFQQLNCNQVNE